MTPPMTPSGGEDDRDRDRPALVERREDEEDHEDREGVQQPSCDSDIRCW